MLNPLCLLQFYTKNTSSVVSSFVHKTISILEIVAINHHLFVCFCSFDATTGAIILWLRFAACLLLVRSRNDTCVEPVPLTLPQLSDKRWPSVGNGVRCLLFRRAAAAANGQLSPPRPRYPPFPSSSHGASWRSRRRCGHLRLLAQGADLLGDFGARDPFPEEIESNFCEKVLGNTDTMHRILIPSISALSLSQMSCEPISSSQPPISTEDAEKLLRKVVGWRLVDGDGGKRIQCLWKVRDYGCGVQLITRIYRVTEAAGHFPNLHLEQPNQVRAELWTNSIGGLSMNDFIVAATIDQIKTLDLLPKKRIWA